MKIAQDGVQRNPGNALDWLRSKGEGHLTRINDILSNLMEAERRIGSGRQTQDTKATLRTPPSGRL
jgi:hypothetical protein